MFMLQITRNHPCLPGSSNESLSTFKQAEQSTTYRPVNHARLAVDWDPISLYEYCTYTNNQPEDWWMVDVGRVFQMTTVTIKNRIDYCNCGTKLPIHLVDLLTDFR
ncbi:hypothetical protein DPMN_139979 [Dreissena polymorpha]|uniref:Uncharacterized protein n=1 Tax=Dreissena polymorpha TaxID=45954 RepID=A0A9D4G6R3_DREPO|nr:hypothetical protein DPMN_139979 [Dreissena polymorpha]